MVIALARSVRSLALKIASYGVMHLVVAMLVAFAITRDWRMALAIGVIEPFLQTIAYSFHDRVWHRIERRRMGSSIEETAEAFTARLNVMDAEEQARTRPHHGHVHGLPSFKRIAIKTLTYGAMHFVVAVTVAFAVTQDIRSALAIGFVEPLVQMVFFTVHDRIWAAREARRSRQAPQTA
jgi:uncharacterized membrane protein